MSHAIALTARTARPILALCFNRITIPLATCGGFVLYALSALQEAYKG